jgi:hypothetical protein
VTNSNSHSTLESSKHLLIFLALPPHKHTQLSSVKSNGGGGGKRAKPGDMSRRRSITLYVCKREAAVFSLASFSHARASLIRRGCLFFFLSREKENRCLVLDSCLVLLEDQVPFVFTAFIVLWTKECNVFFLKAEESEGN